MIWLIAVGFLLIVMTVGLFFFTPTPQIDINEVSEKFACLRHDWLKLNKALKSAEINRKEYDEELEELQVQALELDKSRLSYSETILPQKVVLSIFVFLCILSISLYLSLGSPWSIDKEFLNHHVRNVHSAPGVNMEKMAQALKKLEATLSRTEQELVNWDSLAKSYAYLEDWTSAVRVCKVINEINPNNAETLANLADFIAAEQQMSLDGEPERYIDQALQINPNCVKALSLKATLCFNRSHYKEAIFYWSRQLKNLTPDSDEYKNTEANIAEAKALLK